MEKLTRMEYFAGQALTGLLAGRHVAYHPYGDLVEAAFAVAQGMEDFAQFNADCDAALSPSSAPAPNTTPLEKVINPAIS